MPNWNEVLREIQEAQRAVDNVRRRYLGQLQQHTGRNVIAYYSGFLSKPSVPSGIQDEDKNGFMMAVHKLDKKLGLDLILHTEGGEISATHSLVNYLQQIFGTNIRTIVPQIAMSAGTMIACCSREILMGKHSNLGPIDPQIRGAPAYGIVLEFKRAFREVKRDPDKIAVWEPIIRQYRPSFLTTCENAIKWSNSFVAQQLRDVMFAGEADARAKAKKVVQGLAHYKKNRTHARHIHFDECVKLGLKVTAIESDNALQDLVLTVHHCYMHTLMNSQAYKIIENHKGIAFIKNQVAVP
jgi:hypothetical protein